MTLFSVFFVSLKSAYFWFPWTEYSHMYAKCDCKVITNGVFLSVKFKGLSYGGIPQRV
ncbi:hypothetical protein CRENPOLYSF2_120002 [Crenothrix polyspora]|uniref:Uncharacterized protein n=1 Tax=Crenothrix polyspora TaxID=360316 RepID=A0A1R4GZY6_9GAMM|nr:hypothetical protein CRENPOLYSF2_120002 [Crenothrix polyspora]